MDVYEYDRCMRVINVRATPNVHVPLILVVLVRFPKSFVLPIGRRATNGHDVRDVPDARFARPAAYYILFVFYAQQRVRFAYLRY